MGKLDKWVKSKMAGLSLALYNVEKNALNQDGASLSDDVKQVRRHTQGQLMDSLINGEITQEVIDLRWRTYKVLREADGYIAEIIGEETAEDGTVTFITKTRKVDKKRGLENIKLDYADCYPLEIMLENKDNAVGVFDSMDMSSLNLMDKPEAMSTKVDNIRAKHGFITAEDYFATLRPERPLKVGRKIVPKFDLEAYTKKLNIRTINETEKLIEFYVSKYPDEENRRTYLFIKEIQKAIKNPLQANMLDISEVSFITDKTLGTDDFMEYKYEILSFDKIVDFNGHYVIKFKAKVMVDGFDILEKHRSESLDERYEKREAKKQ